jgi:hypothetical protein
MSLLSMTIEPRETETPLQLLEGRQRLCLRAPPPVCRIIRAAWGSSWKPWWLGMADP